MKYFGRQMCLIYFSAALMLLPSVQTLSAICAQEGDPVIGECISKAIAYDAKLWLLGRCNRQTGGLISLDLSNDARRVPAAKDVIDIAEVGNTLWMLKQSQDKGTFVLARLDGSSFREVAKFTVAKQDEPVAILDVAGTPVVISRQSFRSLSGDGKLHVTQIKPSIQRGGQISVASTGDGRSIYLGFNMGEWGGGLERLDMDSGVLFPIESRAGPKLCQGPLNADCDPVTGVIADPKERKCVLASVGLSHMLEHGRILRVCGRKVNVVWQKSFSVDVGRFFGGRWEMTEAVFGLALSPDGTYWGITSHALYYFSPDGVLQREFAFPKLRSVSGIYLTTKLPGVVVVQTDANWAVSLSGYTPLVVPSDHVPR